MWQTNLIKLYCAVCDNSSTIEAVMQRQSNNFRPQFSDEECITVYLWGISQRRFEQKTIYNYTKNHLLDWFPELPSYAAFSRRLNALVPAFQALAELWLNAVADSACGEAAYIVDSCPVILAKGPRSGHAKVAAELCEKSYNSSRDEWYYGVKLHAFVSRHTGQLPTPLTLMVSGSAIHDLTAAKQIIEDGFSLNPGNLFADKAYIDAAWAESLMQNHSIRILTPRKKHKGDPIISGDTVSTFVSSIRQPIECFFNWLNRLTNLSRACFFISSAASPPPSLLYFSTLDSHLKWSDIDLKKGIIHVRRQILRQNGKVIEAPLKTKNSYRNIAIGADTIEILQGMDQSSEYVFPSPHGGPMSPDSVLHMLQRVLKRAGLERIRFHDLRHTFSVLALQNGVDVKTLSAMLGRYSAGFTLDTYAHVTTSMQKQAANAVGSFLSATLQP